LVDAGPLIVLLDRSDVYHGKVLAFIRDVRCRFISTLAATLVVAAEKTGIRRIVSIGSDFDVYRLPGKWMIQNIFTGIQATP
jgi:hypothetical protein